MLTQPGTNQVGIVELLGSFGKKAPLAHAEAARRNGLRSRGPKTAAGKAISAMNSLRHGMRAANVVLPTEDRAAWESHCRAIVASLKPRTALETWFAERIALETWRLDRGARVEHAIVSSQMRLDEARREAGNEGGYVLGRIVARMTGGEKYRGALLETIKDLEARIDAFLRRSQRLGESAMLDAYDRELLCVACGLPPEEMGAESCGESVEEAVPFLEGVAQAMGARLGRAFDIKQMFRHAVEVLRGSANDMRNSLAVFDLDVVSCLERKALPKMDRLDLLLRYEGAASRSLSRMLGEYRKLRAESDPLEGEVMENLSSSCVVLLRAVEG